MEVVDQPEDPTKTPEVTEQDSENTQTKIIQKYARIDLSKKCLADFDLNLKRNKFGAACLKANHLDKAEKLLQIAIKECEELNIPFTNAYMNLGNVYAQMKNYPKAIEYFLKVIHESPHNEENKGLKFDDVHEYFIMNVHVNNRQAYADAHTNAAFTYLGMQNPEKAYEYSTMSLELDPDNREAHINFGNAQRQIGRRDEAIKLTWELIKRDYKNSNNGEELVVEPIDLNNYVKPDSIDNEETVRIITVKWGTKYDADYVNKVYAGIKRYTQRPFTFICFTDNKEGLDENIEPREQIEDWKGWWGKATIFSKVHGFGEGLNYFIDLDMIISGSLDGMFEFMGRFALLRTDEIENEQDNKGGYNSSVLIWRGEEFCMIYEVLKKAFDQVGKYLFR